MDDLRSAVIDRVLRHFANNYLRRVCRASTTGGDAARFLKQTVSGGYGGPDMTWMATNRGVAYLGPRSSFTDLDEAPVIPWREIAQAARADGEQLALEVSR